jgi:hypothetical protein
MKFAPPAKKKPKKYRYKRSEWPRHRSKRIVLNLLPSEWEFIDSTCRRAGVVRETTLRTIVMRGLLDLLASWQRPEVSEDELDGSDPADAAEAIVDGLADGDPQAEADYQI